MSEDRENWVRIIDKLPTAGDWVLIYTPVRDGGLIEVALLSLFEGFINPAMGMGSFKNVSHWMPLPLPPQDEKDVLD